MLSDPDKRKTKRRTWRPQMVCCCRSTMESSGATVGNILVKTWYAKGFYFCPLAGLGLLVQLLLPSVLQKRLFDMLCFRSTLLSLCVQDRSTSPSVLRCVASTWREGLLNRKRPFVGRCCHSCTPQSWVILHSS